MRSEVEMDAALDVLDIKNQCILGTLEQLIAQNKGNHPARKRHNHGLRRGELAVIDRQAKTVQRIQQWIEAKQRPVSRRDKIQGVDYRTEVEPRLENNLEDMGHVPEENIDHGKEKTAAKRKQDQTDEGYQ